jgi:hypothetical protein
VAPIIRDRKVKITLNNWPDFKERSTKPELLAYNMRDNKITISALKDGYINSYIEFVSEISMTIEKIEQRVVVKGLELSRIEDHPFIFNGKLRCGLALLPRKTEFSPGDGKIIQKINYDLDTEDTRNWLLKLLGADKNYIIYGEIEF